MNTNKWQSLLLGLLVLSGLVFLACLFTFGLFPWPVSILIGLIALAIGGLAGGFFWYLQEVGGIRWIFLGLCILCIVLYGLGIGALVHAKVNVSGQNEAVSIPVEIKSEEHGLKELETVGYLAKTQETAVQQCVDQLKAEGVDLHKKPFESLENLVYAERQGKIQGILLTGESLQKMEYDKSKVVQDYLRSAKTVYDYAYDPFSAPVTGLGYDLTERPFQILISGGDQASEVNLLLTVQPEEEKILMTVLPADLYVEMDCPANYACAAGQMDVLANAGKHSVETVRSTVEKLLDTRISYVVKIDGDGVRTVINGLDGIPIDSSDDGYWLPEGDVNADSAYWFLRHRYWNQDGGYLEDAVSVTKGILQKLIQASPEEIDDAMKGILTDLRPEQVKALAAFMQDKEKDWSFQVQWLEGESGQAVGEESGQMVSIVIPGEKSLETVKAKISRN